MLWLSYSSTPARPLLWQRNYGENPNLPQVVGQWGSRPEDDDVVELTTQSGIKTHMWCVKAETNKYRLKHFEGVKATIGD